MGTIHKHWIFWTTISFVALTIIAFIWKDWYFTLKSDINGEKFGQFGEFLSGTLGTIFAGISLILIILTLRIQNTTFDLSKRNNEFDFTNYLYDRISKEIDDSMHMEYKGINAFYKFELDPEKDIKFLDTLNLVLLTFETFFSMIEKYEFVDETLKTQAKNRFYLLYYTKILWPLHETMIKNGEKFIKGLHDDSRLIIPKYAKNSIACIEYLITANLAAKSDWKENKKAELRKLIIE